MITRTVVQSQPCILQLMEMRLENAPEVNEWQCELHDDDASNCGLRFVGIKGLNTEDLMALRSGDAALYVKGAKITRGVLQVPNGGKKEFSRISPRGPAAESKKDKGNNNGTKRGLAVATNEVRTVLAVRINAKDSAVSHSASVLRNAIFGSGIGSSSNTLKERYESCSYNDIIIQPATGQGITNGVMELSIAMNANGVGHAVLREEAIRVLTNQLGDLTKSFDHVMLCLPGGTSGGWIGYAYVGGHISVYNNNWCVQPSIQVHEIGHNLRLTHAHEKGIAYEDETGFMGTSYIQAGGTPQTRVCFNPAKSWQLGLYGNRRMDLDFSTAPGFQGQLIGVDDYENPNGNGKYVTVRVSSSRVNYDVFIGFNVKKGINADSREYGNMVTITTQNGEAVSDLVRVLAAKGSHRISNWADDGSALNIVVNSINLGVNPPVANVKIFVDGCEPGNGTPQCNGCKSNSDCKLGGRDACAIGTCSATGTCDYDYSPCAGFFLDLGLDFYPQDISWEVRDLCKNKAVVLSGGGYTQPDSRVTEMAALPSSRYEFHLYDSYGDGLCCGPNNEPQSFTATYMGKEILSSSGGAIGSGQSAIFGASSCPGGNPLPPPTLAPVPPPTPPPVQPSPAPVVPIQISSEGRMELEINLDYYPTDTSWVVKDVCDNNKVVAKGNGYTKPDQKVVELRDLPNTSRYAFKFYDSYGDGLCCGAGNLPQSMTLKYEGKTVLTKMGKDIGFEVSTFFGQATCNTSNDIQFSLAFGLDWYPTDTSFTVVDLCDKDKVVLSGGNYVEQDEAITLNNVKLPSSRYEFRFVDSYGDGLCCGPGNIPQNLKAWYNGKLILDVTGKAIGFGKSVTFGNSQC